MSILRCIPTKNMFAKLVWLVFWKIDRAPKKAFPQDFRRRERRPRGKRRLMDRYRNFRRCLIRKSTAKKRQKMDKRQMMLNFSFEQQVDTHLAEKAESLARLKTAPTQTSWSSSAGAAS